jgi:hypothetical protein
MGKIDDVGRSTPRIRVYVENNWLVKIFSYPGGG